MGGSTEIIMLLHEKVMYVSPPREYLTEELTDKILLYKV